MNAIDFLLGLSSEFSTLKRKVRIMEPVVAELMTTVSNIKGALPGVADAVNALEAAVTAAGGMSQEDKDAITAATNDLKDALQGITDAVADAGDGTDEGATPPTP